jgi:hypothetical protein
MNLSKKNVLLISFILVSITYAFVYVNDSIQKEYFSNTVMSLLIFV